MRRFSSTASRIVFLHIIAVALTAVFMPLVLFWLLSQETGSLHQRATEEPGKHSRTVPLGLVRRANGARTSASAEGAIFTSLRSIFLCGARSRRKSAVFLGAGCGAAVSIRGFSPRRLKFTRCNAWQQDHFGVTIPETVGRRQVFVQVGEDLSHRDVLTDESSPISSCAWAGSRCRSCCCC